MRLLLPLILFLSLMSCSVADDTPEAQSVAVWTPSHAWLLTFKPDGSVHAQYGSTLGDGASVPAGTVDFLALLDDFKRLQTDERLKTAQVAIQYEGQTSTTAFSLRDDTLLRNMMNSFRNDWQPDPGGNRFHQLLKKYPLFSE